MVETGHREEDSEQIFKNDLDGFTLQQFSAENLLHMD
jgi:hypothetical protein